VFERGRRISRRDRTPDDCVLAKTETRTSTGRPSYRSKSSGIP